MFEYFRNMYPCHRHLKAFWSKSQKQDFFQISDLCKNTANNGNFYYKTNFVKINDQIFL